MIAQRIRREEIVIRLNEVTIVRCAGRGGQECDENGERPSSRGSVRGYHEARQNRPGRRRVNENVSMMLPSFRWPMPGPGRETAMAQRDLTFKTYSEIAKEIESLAKGGYSKGGKWSLGQVCRHLSFYYSGSLDGFPKMLPWILRVTLGRMMLKSALSGAKTKPGGPTNPASVYEEAGDKEAAAEAVALLARLDKNPARMHPSALYGDLTNEEWRILHMRHSAHHLSFLFPAK
jgi:hypothetical protein